MPGIPDFSIEFRRERGRSHVVLSVTCQWLHCTMFLLPVTGAAACDAVVVYLCSVGPASAGLEASVPIDAYLPMLSVMRLALLMPLTVHSSKGTHVFYPKLYYLVYALSGVAVLLHIVHLSNSSSQKDDNEVPDTRPEYDDDATLLLMVRRLARGLAILQQVATHEEGLIPTRRQQHMWVVLSLSLFSTLLHILILLHVRSTAPSTGLIPRKGRQLRGPRKLLAYGIYRNRGRDRHYGITLKNNYSSSEDSCEDEDCREADEADPFLGDTMQLYHMDTIADTLNGTQNLLLISGTEEKMPLSQKSKDGNVLMPKMDSNNIEIKNDSKWPNRKDAYRRGKTHLRRKRSGGDRSRNLRRLADIQGCLPDNYDDFVFELQARFLDAKQQWSSRLEDFTGKIHLQTQSKNDIIISDETGNRPALATSQQAADDDDTTASDSDNVYNKKTLFRNLSHLTPFRALLQLYAYQDVFKTRKLERAFSATNDNDALVFYAPQLLSFLLHGAFLNSEQLERWILKKCRTNLHFAHRCFWFLRSWCLGSGTHNQLHHFHYLCDGKLKSTVGIGFDDNLNNVDTMSLVVESQQSNSFSEACTQSSSVDPLAAKDEKPKLKKSKSSFVLLETKPPSQFEQGSEFQAEDRVLIEKLLFKIAECGQKAVQDVQHGVGKIVASKKAKNNSNNDVGTASASLIHSVNGKDPNTIPVGPSSDAHLDTLIATETHGLMSHSDIEEGNALGSPGQSAKNSFFGTPRFLDSLIGIADDLMLQPRTHRTLELRRRLRALEAELLPSNVIYVPVNNSLHRVCRIVAAESVALSTKERVPCIICLEVINYQKIDIRIGKADAEGRSVATKSKLNAAPRRPSQTNLHFYNSGLASERDILVEWYKDSRPPQRHSTLFDKVSTYTQRGLQKLRHDIEGSIQKRNEHKRGNSGRQMSLPTSVSDIFNPRQRERSVLLQLPSSCTNSDNESSSSTIAGTELSPRDTSNQKATGRYEEANFDLDTTQSMPGLSHSFDTLEQKELAQAFSFRSSLLPPSIPSSAPSSRASSRPPSPTTAMGQWSTTTQASATDASPIVSKLNSRYSNSKKRHSERQLLETSDIEPNGAVCSHHNGDGVSVSSKLTSIKRRSVTSSGLESSSQHDSTKGDIETGLLENVFSTSKLDQPLDPLESSQSTSQQSRLEKTKSSDAITLRPPFVVFKEDWSTKEKRIRAKSAYGSHPNWRLLPILIKSNDDLRQEQLASQLIYCMAVILARGKVPVWLNPYEILALTDRGGIVEAIPDTISIDSLKRNNPKFSNLKTFFIEHFGPPGCDEHSGALANFVESLAAYSIVCFLLQLKDRHNGNILLDNKGHLIHIDFGFFFLSSPGKNSGFESAPFKLTRDFVNLMDGPKSRTFMRFRDLCYRTFLQLRKHCYQIILLVEMLMEGNEDLSCFRGEPEEAVRGLQERFQLDLNDNACLDYVNSLIDESLENWRTRWYDRYQRFCVGVL